MEALGVSGGWECRGVECLSSILASLHISPEKKGGVAKTVWKPQAIEPGGQVCGPQGQTACLQMVVPPNLCATEGHTPFKTSVSSPVKWDNKGTCLLRLMCGLSEQCVMPLALFQTLCQHPLPSSSTSPEVFTKFSATLYSRGN